MKEPKYSLFQSCIDIYDQFCKDKIGVGAKIDGQQGKAMKSILSYLKRQCDGNEKMTEQSWSVILGNWDSLDKWQKNRVKLSEINSDLLNIINQIKNGRGQNSKNTGTELNQAINDRFGPEEYGGS